MPATDPNASDGAAVPDSGAAWNAIDLNRPGWGDDAYAGGLPPLGGIGGLSPDLGQQVGRALLAGVLGQDPSTVDQRARGFLNTVTLPLTTPSYPQVGLLDPLGDTASLSAGDAVTWNSPAPVINSGKSDSLTSGGLGDGSNALAYGGDGAQNSRFARDSEGRYASSDELEANPKFSDSAKFEISSGYRASRDNGRDYHPGIDGVPQNADGSLNINAHALSLTSGTVVKVGAAGFGPNSITVKTPEGNFVTYGHLNSTNLHLGDAVKLGSIVGVIGDQGNVRPRGVAGTHLHVQISTGGANGFDSSAKFLNPIKPFLRGSLP